MCTILYISLRVGEMFSFRLRGAAIKRSVLLILCCKALLRFCVVGLPASRPCLLKLLGDEDTPYWMRSQLLRDTWSRWRALMWDLNGIGLMWAQPSQSVLSDHANPKITGDSQIIGSRFTRYDSRCPWSVWGRHLKQSGGILFWIILLMRMIATFTKRFRVYETLQCLLAIECILLLIKEEKKQSTPR